MRRSTLIGYALSVMLLGLPAAGTAEDGLQLTFDDYTVAVEHSSAGPLYTVTSRDGALLGADLSDRQLLDRYPHLYDQVKTAIAEAQPHALASRDGDSALPIPLAITTDLGAPEIPLAITTFATPH
jgi:hypothetical protein